MDLSKKFALLFGALLLLINFAFADVTLGPVENGLILFGIGIIGIVVIGIVTVGIFLIYKLYEKINKKPNSINAEKKIMKIFKILVILLVIILVILFIASFFIPQNNSATRNYLNNKYDAKNQISSALLNAMPLGETITEDFILKNDELIKTQDLAEQKNFSAGVLFFVRGQFKDSDPLEIGENGEYVKYTGATQRIIAAKVVCRRTVESLKEILSMLDGNYSVSDPPVTCKESSTCCAIVLLKR